MTNSVLATVLFIIVFFGLELTVLALIHNDSYTWDNLYGIKEQGVTVDEFGNYVPPEIDTSIWGTIGNSVSYIEGVISVFSFGLFIPDNISSSFAILMSFINWIFIIIGIVVVYMLIRSGAN